MVHILLFTDQSLRLDDHPALVAAMKDGAFIVPVFIADPHIMPSGGAARWWLGQSLLVLRESLRAMGSNLIVRRGTIMESLPRLMSETGAKALFFQRRYGQSGTQVETLLKQVCEASGASLHPYGGHLLFEPDTIATQAGKPYTVFTPFYKACLAKGCEDLPVDAPGCLAAPENWPRSDPISTLSLTPAPVDWALGLRQSWQPGEAGAKAALVTFKTRALDGYKDYRDRPDIDGTSRLSPHLRFGEISPRRIFWALVEGHEDRHSEAFIRELGWREFSYHLLHHFDDLAKEPLRRRWQSFPWRSIDDAPDAFTAWTKGQTGFPIIDAGMRQLWQTGWMHNRVRMIAASFLVKDLMIHWRHGEAWFLDTLVDADPANNPASWQWVAGCGADAAPYFRIFNPTLQGEKFDPDGHYIRRYLPEIARLPKRYIHKPFEAPQQMLVQAGLRLGHDYPLPIIDRAIARKQALAAFQAFKGAAIDKC